MIELLTDTEAAKVLGCSPRKIKQLRLNGRIPFIPGRSPLIERCDLEDVLFEKRVKAATFAYGPPSIETVKSEAAKRAARLWLRFFGVRDRAAEAATLTSLQLRERNGVWFVHWSFERRYRSVSTRQRTRAGAEAFRAEWHAWAVRDG